MKDSRQETIKAILFDLDGTLLRVQMSEFIPRYIAGLAELCKETVAPKKFTEAMIAGIRNLIRFPGTSGVTNEQRFCDFLQQRLAIPANTFRQCLYAYQQNGLAELQGLVKGIPLAKQIIAECHPQIPLVLATNPVFPGFMIDARLDWAELGEVAFTHVTNYENSCYCKPHAGYFQEIAEQLGLPPQQCLMVGNDTQHDMAAAAIGMQTFLVDTWIIEREGADWPYQQRGDHLALQKFLRERLAVS